MLSFEPSLIQGAPWKSEAVAIFTASIGGHESAPAEARIDIEAAFRAHRIPTGLVVKAEVSIGCTGAHFRLEAVGAEFRSWYEGDSLGVQYEISAERSASVSAKLSRGEAQISETTFRKSGFDGLERSVAAVKVAPHVVEWTCEIHRGEMAFRDFLLGNLRLWATCPVQGRVDIKSSAKPRDRRFFGPDNRALSALKSFGIYAKLRAQKVTLPVIDAVSHRMIVSGEPSVPSPTGNA